MYLSDIQSELAANLANDPLTYLIGAFLLGVVLASLVALVLSKSPSSDAMYPADILALHIEKNEQFRTAITSSWQEIIDKENEHWKLAHEAEERGDKKLHKEENARFRFYLQVKSYAEALQKHGWERKVSQVND